MASSRKVILSTSSSPFLLSCNGSEAPTRGSRLEELVDTVNLTEALEVIDGTQKMEIPGPRIRNEHVEQRGPFPCNFLDDPEAQDPFEQTEPSPCDSLPEPVQNGPSQTESKSPVYSSGTSGSNFQGIVEYKEGIWQTRARHPYHDKAFLSSSSSVPAAAGLSAVPVGADKADVINIDAPTVVPNSKAARFLLAARESSFVRKLGISSIKISKIAKSLNCFEGLVALPSSNSKRSSGTVQHIVINRESEYQNDGDDD